MKYTLYLSIVLLIASCSRKTDNDLSPAAKNNVTITSQQLVGNEWKNIVRGQYTYNDTGRTVLIQDWDVDAQKWVNESRTIAGKKSLLHQRWINNAWTDHYSIFYTRDQRDSISESTQYLSTGEPNVHTYYFYDTNYKLAKEIRYVWNNGWGYPSQVRYNYDEKGRITSNIFYNYPDSINYTLKYTFTYDAKGYALTQLFEDSRHVITETKYSTFPDGRLNTGIQTNTGGGTVKNIYTWGGLK